jgi:S1-C subfamily serine protease
MRALIIASLVAFTTVASAQTTTGLHIEVRLATADGSAIPMRGVVLLISANPATAEPRRILTTADGTVDVNLRPGSYTVESDQPVAFQGQGYEWTQIVNVVSGQRASLVLTARNAEVGPISASAKPVDAGSIVLFDDRQASVVELWSATGHAAGFVVDAKGLIATNQRALGDATTVEVQLTPAIKVSGRVVVSDRARDVAIVWIDPHTIASLPAVTVTCDANAPRTNSGPDIFTITIPMLGRKDLSWGTRGDLRITRGSSGGPVFTKEGALIGLTTDGDFAHEMRAPAHVIPINNLCEPLATAVKKIEGDAPPAATQLPVEPAIAASAPKPVAANRRGGAAIEQPRIEAGDFSIALVRPMPPGEFRVQSTKPEDFGDWYDYVLQAPPLLYLRAIPKLEESLMMKVGRAAAATQGAVIPPIPHLKASFLKMRAYCGDEEVTPIHAFTIERSPDEKTSVKEGLYAFDPASLGPNCSSVKVMLYSQKEPNKADVKTIEPALLKP